MATPIYENIKQRCKELNISVNKLEDETGIPRNYLANWNDGPRWSTYLPLVAKRLDTSIDSLMYAEKSDKSAVDRVKLALDGMVIDDDTADAIIGVVKIIANRFSQKE